MIEEDVSLQKQCIPLLQELLELEGISQYPYVKTYEEAKDDPILVMHTSGTTGDAIPNEFPR